MANVKDEALRMAIEIMQRYLKETPLGNQPHMIAHKAEETIQACKEALEQPTPSWQGLSDDEINEQILKASIPQYQGMDVTATNLQALIRAVEQVLKEKNYGN